MGDGGVLNPSSSCVLFIDGIVLNKNGFIKVGCNVTGLNMYGFNGGAHGIDSFV